MGTGHGASSVTLHLYNIKKMIFDNFSIYRSKGLLAHLIKRKHYVAAKYIDFLPDIIYAPDYIGLKENEIDFVKCYKDNIYVCIKIDHKNGKHYIATMFEVKQAKIDSNVRANKWVKVDL